MKIYACENCSYRSKRLADLQRHKNKKSQCINKIKVNVDKEKGNIVGEGIHSIREGIHPTGEGIHPTGEGIHPTGEGIHSTGEGIHSTGEGIHSTGEGIHSTGEGIINAKNKQCNICFKLFVRAVDCRNHKQKCDGTHHLQCRICLKMFASAQSKYNHKKNVKCSPPAIEKATTNNNMNNCHNNISMDKPTIYTNNNNITNNNFNLIKADFGKECLQRLCSNEKYTQNMIENLDLGRYAIPKTIEQIYFNDDFPENQTLKKERRTDKLVSIQRKGKWETRFFEDICQDLIKKTEAYHQKYFEDLKIKYKDTPKDKKFKEILMPIIIFARMMKKHGINLDLKELGIHLDDEELEDEDYKQILCFRKDMEILMLDEIHEQTVKQPEAIDDD
jgi:hypothetical protein